MVIDALIVAASALGHVCLVVLAVNVLHGFGFRPRGMRRATLSLMAASGLATISVPLVAPETEYTPRINQFDFSASKSLEFGAIRLTPKLDLFNALNSDDYTSVSSTQFGAATYMRPSVILHGRIIRIGVNASW